MKGLAGVVLAEHEVTFTEVDGHEWRWRCSCKASGGAISPRPEVTAKRAHRTHVGEAIDDKIRERLAGARKDVARALAQMEPGEEWPTNAALGGGLTGTRDDEYRAAMQDDADAALAAVAEALGVGEVRG